MPKNTDFVECLEDISLHAILNIQSSSKDQLKFINLFIDHLVIDRRLAYWRWGRGRGPGIPGFYSGRVTHFQP